MVDRPRIISTSDMRGTGLKKCIPITRSARLVTAARRVMSMEDVLEATIASGPSRRSKLLENGLLRVEVLEDGLDHEVTVREIAKFSGGGDAG